MWGVIRAEDAHGSILVVTLWLVLTLAMVAIALAAYLSTETRLMRVRLARAQAKTWARAGVMLGLERLADDLAPPQDGADWLGERWASAWTIALPLAGDAAFQGRVSIVITDEDRTLDMNRIEDPAIHRVVDALTGNTTTGDLVADYVDADERARPSGLEAQEAPAWYRAKNGPIAVMEELRQIPGLADEQYALLAHETSAWLAPASTINLNTADASLVQALFVTAGEPALAEQVVAYRWDPADGADPEGGNHFVQLRPEVQTRGAPLDPGVKDALARVMTGPVGAWLGVQSSVFRVAVTTEIAAPPVRAQMVAVVRRAAPGGALQVGNVSFQMLGWREG